MGAKQRVTVTVDAALARAVAASVKAGRADSFSACVNDALAVWVKDERHRIAREAAVAAYETEYGKFTDEEMELHRETARRNTVMVRGGRIIAPKRRKTA